MNDSKTQPTDLGPGVFTWASGMAVDQVIGMSFARPVLLQMRAAETPEKGGLKSVLRHVLRASEVDTSVFLIDGEAADVVANAFDRLGKSLPVGPSLAGLRNGEVVAGLRANPDEKDMQVFLGALLSERTADARAEGPSDHPHGIDDLDHGRVGHHASDGGRAKESRSETGSAGRQIFHDAVMALEAADRLSRNHDGSLAALKKRNTSEEFDLNSKIESKISELNSTRRSRDGAHQRLEALTNQQEPTFFEAYSLSKKERQESSAPILAFLCVFILVFLYPVRHSNHLAIILTR